MTLVLIAPASMLLATAVVDPSVAVGASMAPLAPVVAAAAQPSETSDTAPAALAPTAAAPPPPSDEPSATRASPPVADATVEKSDPLEGFNRAMFGLHEGLDKALYRPAAMVYKTIMPKPVRSGIRNILSNLTEPVVALNFLLQGKPGKAAETIGRLAINTTLGLGGMFDVAKSDDIRLPYRRNGLGDTLAIWGIGPGPYLFIPLVGPSTLRDIVGEPADAAVLPTMIGYPFKKWQFQIASTMAEGLDLRAESDGELKALYADAIDRYATLRSVWLQNRVSEIAETRGSKAMPSPDGDLEDPLADPASGVTTTAPAGAGELADPLEDPQEPAVEGTPPNEAR